MGTRDWLHVRVARKLERAAPQSIYIVFRYPVRAYNSQSRADYVYMYLVVSLARS
jgi:hypothetical protein